MQNVTPQPTPSPPIRGVVVPGLEGTPAISIPVPRTAADLDALRARRSELSDQLQSVDGRRSKLLSQLQKLRDGTASREVGSLCRCDCDRDRARVGRTAIRNEASFRWPGRANAGRRPAPGREGAGRSIKSAATEWTRFFWTLFFLLTTRQTAGGP